MNNNIDILTIELDAFQVSNSFIVPTDKCINFVENGERQITPIHQNICSIGKNTHNG